MGVIETGPPKGIQLPDPPDLTSPSLKVCVQHFKPIPISSAPLVSVVRYSITFVMLVYKPDCSIETPGAAVSTNVHVKLFLECRYLIGSSKG